MSDTPRTDAMRRIERHGLWWVPEDDFRQLERENAELRDVLDDVYHNWPLHGIAPELEETILRLLKLKKAKP